MHAEGFFEKAAGMNMLDEANVAEFHRRFVDRVDIGHLTGLKAKKQLILYYDPFVGLKADGTIATEVIAKHNEVLANTKVLVAGDKAPALTSNSSVASSSVAEDEEEATLPEAPAEERWSSSQRDAFTAIVRLGNFEFSPVLGMHGAAAFKKKSSLYVTAAEAPSQAMLLIERVIKDRQASTHTRIAVFAEQVTQLRILMHYLEGKDVGELFLFHGQLDATARDEMVKDFLACDKGVILLSKAGGVGINLQKGCEVMLSVGSLPWNATDMDQAFGRIYRRGQEQPVEIIQFIARRSVTAAKQRLHDDKRDRLAAATYDQDYANFADGSTQWRETKDVLSYVGPLDDATGNYTVVPGLMDEVDQYVNMRLPEYKRKLSAYETALPLYEAKKARGEAGATAPQEPKEPKDIRHMGLPVLPSRMALPDVSFRRSEGDSS